VTGPGTPEEGHIFIPWGLSPGWSATYSAWLLHLPGDERKPAGAGRPRSLCGSSLKEEMAGDGRPAGQIDITRYGVQLCGRCSRLNVLRRRKDALVRQAPDPMAGIARALAEAIVAARGDPAPPVLAVDRDGLRALTGFAERMASGKEMGLRVELADILGSLRLKELNQ
jgi:hypothetical protein